MQPMPPPPAPPAPGQNKMSPLAWVAIGCGVIVVVCLIVMAGLAIMGGRFLKKTADKLERNPTFAAAELAVKMNPDVELVSSDEDKGTLTIRDKKTGEVVTLNAEDAKNGKWSVTTKEGTATFDASGTKDGGGAVKITNEKGEQVTYSAGAGAPKNLPSWVPVYPGGANQGTYDATTAEARSAMFTMTTSDSVDAVADYYEGQLKSAGLEVRKSSYEAAGQKTVSLNTTGDDKRTVTVVISPSDGKTQAIVTFVDKK